MHLQMEPSFYPFCMVCAQVVVLLGCWGIFVTFQLLLSRWPHCSGPYWAIFAVQAGLCLIAEVAFLRLVRLTLLECDHGFLQDVSGH